MGSIYSTYEKVIIWVIGKLAESIVRSEPISVGKRLNLQPFMKVVRGDTGIRFIGIYCDILWKVVNDAKNFGDYTHITVEAPASPKTPKKTGKKTTRKGLK